jgi:hypothetical protein
MSINNNKKRKTKVGLEKNLMDKQDVLQTLHISERTLQKLRSKKLIPYYLIGGKFYYKYTDILLLLEANIVN